MIFSIKRQKWSSSIEETTEQGEMIISLKNPTRSVVKMIISIGIMLWKDVYSSKKDASIFYSYLYIFLDTKHFSSVIRALF